MSGNSNKYFFKALFWLFIVTIVAFIGDFIEEYFKNSEIIVGISDTISLILWGIFIYYVLVFYKHRRF